ncbi:MAG: hypothetical protein ACRDLL_01255 [Solirubrobacterales bacterium]
MAGEPDFYRAVVATYIGAALGFFVALYLDRLQRSEDDAARARQEMETTRTRRVALMSLLRTELGLVVGQMPTRQDRSSPPFDRLSDILWRSVSLAGEMRWIEDLQLLRQIASTYDLLAVEVDLEQRWLVARATGGGVEQVVGKFMAQQLRLHDRDLWRQACDACKAIDAALVADGEPPGAEIFCPT